MKRIINLSIALILLSVLTSTVFAQSQGAKNKKMVKAQTIKDVNPKGPNWVDVDGDGICDNFGTVNQGQGQGNGKGYGLRDGSNGGVRPQDGTGFGKGSGSRIGSGTETVDCDGTGPKGSRKRGKKK